jgi:hypothetical protein
MSIVWANCASSLGLNVVGIRCYLVGSCVRLFLPKAFGLMPAARVTANFWPFPFLRPEKLPVLKTAPNLDGAQKAHGEG